ncbi:basic blue protein-like [Prosopis cineraria]|uniref:basic blue protein-like n=1 Tax=Prosopis cineraria TaxID=364024 RepID=UPI00241026DA|nr:basic blue protein-like [Prosopis cineraria]
MGRGSASAIISAALVLLFCFTTVLLSDMAQAATFTVGDSGGWTFNTQGWPQGKTFRAGDTLVFNYRPGTHNVVIVNKAGYNTCRTPKGAQVLVSGKDQIKLVKGPNYFICSYPGHCQSAMKIAVNAV